MRRALAFLMIFLPQKLKHLVANRVLGWDIHPTAYIGRSLILANKVTMGPGSSIGPFNVFRDIDELRMGEGANISARNWVIGVPPESVLYPDVPDRDPSLVMGRYAMITVGHEIDVADRVQLGDHAVFAGFGSAILTHSLNLVTDKFVTGKVVLGDYAVLMSGCTMQNGTNIPARSIVSAGSVVATKLRAEQTFYRGNPAEPVRELPETLGFYRRVGRQSQIERELMRWAEVR
ncbi:acyltransferase [Nocardioides sp. SYSU DS0651]|uniref:acyltransferase n=1 Tax=Nocardioides sp. SYSU DS0651 TaxID=3415955 RepID=UPI003F4B57F4